MKIHHHAAAAVALSVASIVAFAAPAGQNQSPVNIVTKSAVETKVAGPTSVAGTFLPTSYNVINTWNPADTSGPDGTAVPKEFGTLKATPAVGSGGNFVIHNALGQFNLLQFHFHTPSEHTVNGRHTPMEAHFVFTNANPVGNLCNDKGLLVIGVRIVAGDRNVELDKIFSKALPLDKLDTAHNFATTLDIGKVIPKLGGTWQYNGSLTAPAGASVLGCSPAEGTVAEQLVSDEFPEVVNWVVSDQVIEMSNAQITAFRALFPEEVGNTREVEELNGRTVRHYSK